MYLRRHRDVQINMSGVWRIFKQERDATPCQEEDEPVSGSRQAPHIADIARELRVGIRGRRVAQLDHYHGTVQKLDKAPLDVNCWSCGLTWVNR
jgi:hypothetical protein